MPLACPPWTVLLHKNAGISGYFAHKSSRNEFSLCLDPSDSGLAKRKGQGSFDGLRTVVAFHRLGILYYVVLLRYDYLTMKRCHLQL